MTPCPRCEVMRWIVKRLVAERGPSPHKSGEPVMQAVCLAHNVTVKDVRSSTRRPAVVKCRCEIVRTLHDDVGMSFPEIGMLMHSSASAAQYQYHNETPCIRRKRTIKQA